jgi:small subunit ribosomal protein S1
VSSFSFSLYFETLYTFFFFFSLGMMMKFKELQQDKKKDSRVQRPLGFDERAPLTAFFPGMEVTGTVISLIKYGAYVDIGTECDGLLHISQITRKFFVEHPRQVLTPGDEVTVRIHKISPELKKMQLTMLDVADVEVSLVGNDNDDDDSEEKTPLTEFEIDDELWGELKRVTDFGAYVEVGAEVDGFLHFMDHPLWEDGAQPFEFMERGQRVRVWVADLDMEKNRIRVTATRPQNLPGPKFEL